MKKRSLFSKDRFGGLIVAVLVFGTLLSAQDLKSRPQGNEFLKLNGSFEIPAEASLGKSAATAMIVSDLNGDGINELVTGRENGISIQMGDINAFAPRTQAAWEAIRDLRFISPFKQEGRSIELPISPDILLAGDFDRDGLKDIAAAAKGGRVIFVIAGDGLGGYGGVREIQLGGRITSLVSGDVNRMDGFPDIIAGTDNEGTFSLSIYQGLGDIFNADPEVLDLASPAEQILTGQFDETTFSDIAVTSGNRIIIFSGHEKDSERAEPLSLPQGYGIRGIASGDFIPDRDHRSEFALLGDDGHIRILARGDLDTRPVTREELMGIEAYGMQKQGMPIPQRILKQIGKSDLKEKAESLSSSASGWNEADSFFGAGPSDAQASGAMLTSARLTNRAGDDLILIDKASSSLIAMPMILTDDGEMDVRTDYARKRQAIRFEVDGAPISIAADRLNFDGDKDLIILEEGKSSPTTLMSAPEAAFTVNNAGDQVDANPGNGVCATAGAVCTLRAAIMEANHLAGTDSITINAGINITLSTGNPDNDANGPFNFEGGGDLDITCAVNAGGDTCNAPLATNVNNLTITGAAGGNTIAVGAFAPFAPLTSTTDRVFDIGFDGLFGGGFGAGTGLVVAMSNLTIQSGNVREDFNAGGGGFGNFARGGAIRLDGFGQGGTRGTLTLTSVTINSNQADHNSGGIFNQFANVTISSSTVSNNIGKAGPGGGLQFAASTPATLSVSGSTFSGNEARTGPIFMGTATDVDGGGIYATLDNNAATITSTNFNSNISQDDGGGLYVASGATTVTNGTMSGNTARDDGGFAAGDNDTVSALRFMTLSGVTIQGNTANSDSSGGGDGGGVFRDRGTLNVTNCFIGAVGQPNTAVNGGGIAHAFRAAVTPSNVTTVNIDNGSIAANNATADGGGTYFNNTNFGTTAGTFNVGSATSVLVSENNSRVHGGGFAVSGGATYNLTRAVFSGNDADSDSNGSGDGGGLFHNNSGGTTTIASTVSFTNNGNGTTTTENGGAIHHSNGTLNLNSPPVSGNDSDAHGGGLFVSGGTVNVNGVTFAANTSTSGTEVRLTGGTTNFSGTVTIPGELSIAGGTLVAGSSTVNLGEDFHFTSGVFTAGTSLFNFNGAAAQQIYGGAVPTFNNLTDSNTAQLLNIQNSINVNGNLTVNANATLNPATATVVGGPGTLTGNGEVRVTRTAATADFLSQYTITNKTLTNLLVDYVGNSPQILSPITYGGLRINTLADVTQNSGTASVNGTLSLTAGTLSIAAATLNINNGSSVGAGIITSSNLGTVNYGQTSGGQSVILSANYGNLTFSNFNKVLPVGTVGITGTFTPGSAVGHTVAGNTINFKGSSAQTIPVFPYNNLTLNNAAGATLAGNQSVPGVLNLISGILATGANTLTVTTTGSLARTTGYVNGTLRKDFPGPGSFVFAVGTASGYAPVDSTVTSGSGNLTVTGIQGPMPFINGTQAIQRYWNLNGTGITTNLVFNYNQTDVLGNESLYRIHKQFLPSNATVAPPNQCPASPCVDTGLNTGTVNGVTSFSNWTIAVPIAPTAANVSVSGRVFAEGMGLRNAIVTITDSTGATRSTRTSSFGYYSFADVAVGREYVVSVAGKGYTFQPQIVTVNDNVSGLDFIAEP